MDRQAAFDAVFAIIRKEPATAGDNARVWRCVYAALNALAGTLIAAESSRRDWAAEAMRLEVELERRADLLHGIWLYVDWRKVTRQLTTEQKDMWADAVEAFSEVLEPGDPVEADRWWRDPGFSRPVCAVHPMSDNGKQSNTVTDSQPSAAVEGGAR